ncbi:hypothetical protein GCM10025883_23590 [Mobilicoccus caccae]|uniref:Uncharacterized protein n=2 Tax=Mobilicoccus caccae TaxID=1859295 RepID=A0ABQ6IQY8_9MICO|nr:hypothetical protein GCM10025883_23590 [Mobilicoccus caccae]
MGEQAVGQTAGRGVGAQTDQSLRELLPDHELSPRRVLPPSAPSAFRNLAPLVLGESGRRLGQQMTPVQGRGGAAQSKNNTDNIDREVTALRRSDLRRRRIATIDPLSMSSVLFFIRVHT